MELHKNKNNVWKGKCHFYFSWPLRQPSSLIKLISKWYCRKGLGATCMGLVIIYPFFTNFQSFEFLLNILENLFFILWMRLSSSPARSLSEPLAFFVSFQRCRQNLNVHVLYINNDLILLEVIYKEATINVSYCRHIIKHTCMQLCRYMYNSAVKAFSDWRPV